MLKAAGPLQQGNYETLGKKTIPNENFSGQQATLDSPQYLLPHVQRGKKRTSSMSGWSGLFSCVVDLQCTEAKSPSVVGTKTENDFEMEDLKSRTSEDLEPGILRRISRPYHRRLVTILYLTFFFMTIILCKYLSPLRNMINKKLEKKYSSSRSTFFPKRTRPGSIFFPIYLFLLACFTFILTLSMALNWSTVL